MPISRTPLSSQPLSDTTASTGRNARRMKPKAQTWRRSMPKRWCNSCCRRCRGRGGQRNRSASRLVATRRGSRPARCGANIARIALPSNSNASAAGNRPSSTARRGAQGCPWRARNRQRAASTRVPISARASCPRAGASGHCAGPWLAKRRSSTSTAKASSRQIPMARSAACPELAGGRSRRQPAATRHNASAALAASHSAACPSWARPWAMAWPRRSRSRS